MIIGPPPKFHGTRDILLRPSTPKTTVRGALFDRLVNCGHSERHIAELGVERKGC